MSTDIKFARPYRLASGKIVEQPPMTRKMRRGSRTRPTDLAWTEPVGKWLPVEKWAVGMRADSFKGVVRQIGETSNLVKIGDE